MTPELVATSVGFAISILLEKFPKFNDWWKKLPYQLETMFVVFLIAPFALYALACNGLDFVQVACPAGAWNTVGFYYEGLKVGLLGFIGSQIGWVTVARPLRKAKA